jgi:hypothetical protein
MNTFGITGIEQMLLGLYLIGHGFIHWIFLIYVKDSKTNTFTGWSRKSWLLDKFLPEKIIKIIGFLTWLTIAVLFIISGLGILDILSLNDLLTPLLITVSILAILAYFIFIDGLVPTPYHWILGIVIDFIALLIVFFSASIQVFLILLVVVWIYGMVFHTRVISFLQTENTA